MQVGESVTHAILVLKFNYNVKQEQKSTSKSWAAKTPTTRQLQHHPQTLDQHHASKKHHIVDLGYPHPSLPQPTVGEESLHLVVKASIYHQSKRGKQQLVGGRN
jgi:hypothetical protein